MRWLFALCTVIEIAGYVWGGPPPQAPRPPQAPPVRAAVLTNSCPCNCPCSASGGVCTCGVCSCRYCPGWPASPKVTAPTIPASNKYTTAHPTLFNGVWYPAGAVIDLSAPAPVAPVRYASAPVYTLPAFGAPYGGACIGGSCSGGR